MSNVKMSYSVYLATSSPPTICPFLWFAAKATASNDGISKVTHYTSCLSPPPLLPQTKNRIENNNNTKMSSLRSISLSSLFDQSLFFKINYSPPHSTITTCVRK